MEWHLNNMPVPEAGEVRRVERRMSRVLKFELKPLMSFMCTMDGLYTEEQHWVEQWVEQEVW